MRYWRTTCILLFLLIVSGCTHRTFYSYERSYALNLRDIGSKELSVFWANTNMSPEERAEQRLSAAQPAIADYARSVTERELSRADARAFLESQAFDCESVPHLSCRADRPYYPASFSPWGTLGRDPTHCFAWIVRETSPYDEPAAFSGFVEEIEC